MNGDTASAQLAAHGARWWREGDIAALDAACGAVPAAALPAWPDVARWRALAALLREGADALSCLERAYDGHRAQATSARPASMRTWRSCCACSTSARWTAWPTG